MGKSENKIKMKEDRERKWRREANCVKLWTSEGERQSRKKEGVGEN